MSLSEDEIVAWIAARSRPRQKGLLIGIGDDMAQLSYTRSKSVLITTDMLLEGVHFDPTACKAEEIGHRAVCISLSDCAAMATIPVALVVSVALPPDFGEVRLKQLHKGISAAATEYDCPLVGGDITVWKTDGPFVINVAMLSRPGPRRPVTRDGAKPHDRLVVTGLLGGGLSRGMKFKPRIAQAINITRLVPIHAMIDISDGLSSDLHRLCAASGVGAIVDAKAIPLSRPARTASDPLASALNDGEDFELLFTLSGAACRRLMSHWKGYPRLTEIGVMTIDPAVRLRDGKKILPLEPHGYDHFRR